MPYLNRISYSAFAATLLASAAIIAGCSRRSPAGNETIFASTPTDTATASANSNNPGVDLQCIADRIQKAPAPLHWSYKKVVLPQTTTRLEADIKPDSIAGTVIDSSGTRAIHAVRSDSESWNNAVLILTGPLPEGTFAMVNHSSAVVRAGAENVNGEDTIKYTIDTSRDTPADAGLINSMLGTNSSIKGMAWVTHAGCLVKFVLDVEQHSKDGSVQKEHVRSERDKAIGSRRR
ncbi:MAG: hypothetical protein ABIY40_07795 [Rhodanobacteraceae bacterium]